MTKSKNRVKTSERKILLDIVEDRSWNILIRNRKEDEKGEYTYNEPRESTIIDYVLKHTKSK